MTLSKQVEKIMAVVSGRNFAILTAPEVGQEGVVTFAVKAKYHSKSELLTLLKPHAMRIFIEKSEIPNVLLVGFWLRQAPDIFVNN
jgi:hypothetical protein